MAHSATQTQNAVGQNAGNRNAGDPAANEATFIFHLQGLEDLELRVTAFDGSEAIGEIFNVRVQLCTDRPVADVAEAVGRNAALEIVGEHGHRWIHGIIRRFALVEDAGRLKYYEADIVPPHWLLTQRVQSRAFQKPRCKDTSVPAIIAEVLESSGLPNDALSFGLSIQYPQREFVVQYAESDWDFICRLMEDEGIYAYFEHDEQGCSLVIADYKDLHMPYVEDERHEVVPYRDPNGLKAEEEHVFAARFAGEIQPGKVQLDDFLFRNPGLELRVSAQADRHAELTVAEYPGGYDKRPDGQTRADRRLEQHQVGRRIAVFETTVRQFQPGRTFVLAEHPEENLNGRYFITGLSHRALQTQSSEGQGGGGAGTRYECHVDVIPADVQYRPARLTARPVIHGSQTALVVGPENEEIYVDEFGRVKVRFHWDQGARHDENASCWIRVSQGWAGGQYGMMFLPRVGQEVIVDYLEGNPDRPIITGRVYNKDHMPPYTLPDRKTVSTIRTCSSPGARGGNEIRFEDAADKEELLLFAQKEMHLRSRGNRYESTGGERHVTVSGDAFEKSRKNRHAAVTLDLVEQVGGTKHLSVDGDVKTFIQGKQTTYVEKQHNLLNGDGIWLGSDTSITLWCKGNFIKLDESGVTIVGKQVRINSGGSASVAMPDSPDPVTDPQAAATTEHGGNTRYDQDTVEMDKLDAGQQAFAAPAVPEVEDDTVSWIEIELVDDLGRPVPGEEYELTEPDGQVTRGSLDNQGRAHVRVKDPGLCQVSFPRLDRDVWEKN